jgi:hypothetical protein
MMTVLRGVYKDGAVHLHEPLALPNNTEVDVSISPVNGHENAQNEREQIHALFLAAGLILPHSQTQAEPPLSPEREAQLAEKLAKAGSLSDLIIKEREEQDDDLLL